MKIALASLLLVILLVCAVVVGHTLFGHYKITRNSRLNSRNARTCNDRGNESRNLGQYKNAIRDYNEAIRLDPQFAYAYNNRGKAYEALGQYQRAIQDYDEAIRLDELNSPDSYVFIKYINRGNAYKQLGQYDRALADYDQAIRYYPEMGMLYCGRGDAYLLVRQYEHAIQDYNESLRIDPHYMSHHIINRGVAHQCLGQDTSAIEDYTTFLNTMGWRHSSSQYAALYSYYSQYRIANDTSAQQIITVASEKCDTLAWPYPALCYLRGDISGNSMLASPNADTTEARYYLGQDLILKGRRADGIRHLLWVYENGEKCYFEYGLAIAELTRLNALPTPPKAEIQSVPAQ